MAGRARVMRASLTTTRRKHNGGSRRPFSVSCRAKSRHLSMVLKESEIPRLPVHFTSLGITDGNCAKIRWAFDCVYFVIGNPAAFQALKPPAIERMFL